MDTPDYNYSSLSELESLSDSDWLDISSRGDDDSVIGFDSDHDDAFSRPVSRRSFSSVASSRAGVVEGWEGLLEDSSDETPHDDCALADMFAHVGAEVSGHSHDASSATVQKVDPEDEQVMAALDQSMMSTLSSPRTNSLSNSIQASIVHSTRSLKLSFPDPTTSTLQSLNTSFEELLPFDADVASADAAVETILPPADSTAEPDHLSTFDVPVDEAHSGEIARSLPRPSKIDFHVVLYGSSPVAKFSFVEMLLDKWAVSGHLIRGQKSIHASNIVMHEYECFTSGAKTTKKVISVVDKTARNNSCLHFELDAPSIALVFLPSFSDICLQEHTIYLPVMMSSSLSMVDVLGSTDYLLEAEQQWEAQAVPSARLTTFSNHASPVVEQDALERATPQQVTQAFRPLLPASGKNTMPKVSANALTIFAILSIVLGYIVHGSFNAPVIDAMTNRTLATPLTGLLRPSLAIANKSQSTALTSVGVSSFALSSPSSKNSAIPVHNSTPASSISATSTAQPASSSSSASTPRATASAPEECGCGCGLLTWAGKTETTDIMLRPTSSGLTKQVDTITSISVLSPPPPHQHKSKGKERASSIDTSFHALSTRIATSLSESLAYAPLGKAVQHDLQEILDAIDQLSSAISRQTSVLWEQSKGAVSTIQEKFEKRNERAKHRAKQIREVGERWISSVKETIKTHTDLAKVNAKAITEQVVEHLEARHKVSKRKVSKRKVSKRKARKTSAHVKTRKQRRSERKVARAAAAKF
ncbi:hypothetical protein BC835DRAFT_1529011 [Cytidiella melzeri]|nr:hypothetical protein BC835DRAFT_1529011 [Cytidiella melzeri]